MSTQTRKIQFGRDPDPYAFLKIPPIDPSVWGMRTQYPITPEEKAFILKGRQMGKSALQRLMNEMMIHGTGFLPVQGKVKKMQTLSDFGRSGEFRLEDVRLALEEYEEQMVLDEDERADKRELMDFLKDFEEDDDYTRFFDGSDAEDLAIEWCNDHISGFDQYSFPYSHIDWDAAGQSLLEDYCERDVGGYTLYYDRY